MSRFQDAQQEQRPPKRSRFDDRPSNVSAPPPLATASVPAASGSSAVDTAAGLARVREIAARLGSVTSSMTSTAAASVPSGSKGGQVEVRKKVYVPHLQFPDVNFRGLLVGPGGKNHKEMEQKSGAKISIRGKGSQKGQPEVEGEDEMHVLIVGDTDDQVRTAEKMVRDILFDPAHAATLKSEQLRSLNGNITGEGSNMDYITAGPNKGPSGLGFVKSAEAAPFSVTMEVNERIVGAIIGRRGETIKEIQERSHADIQVQRDADAEPGSTVRKITIAGREEDVLYAQQLVQERIDDRAQPSGRGKGGHYGPGSVEEKLPVDVSVVGLIIGKQGSTIRSIEEKSGCRLQIPDDTMPGDDSKRLVLVSGPSEEQVQIALEEIKVVTSECGRSGERAPRANAGEANSTFKVPDDKVGLIIGKGGSVIKDLERRTGTNIQIPSEANVIDNTRTVTISGSEQGIAYAKQEMTNLLSQDKNRHSGHYGAQYGGQQWAQQGSNPYGQQQYWQQQQQWQQYYASMGQGAYGAAGQMNPAQATAAPGGTAAAPGTQTGQQPVQHTKEQWEAWRAYYAKMGYQMGEYPGDQQSGSNAPAAPGP